MAEAATWDVYVMEYARSKDQPWVDLISGMYHEGVMDLPFSFIFARRDEDRVLIDTGFMQDDHRSTFSRKFGIPTWISPLRMLAEIGVHADAINAIFLTHAHFDHMGSIAGNSPMRISTFQKSEGFSHGTQSLRAAEAFQSPDRDRRSRQYAHGSRLASIAHRGHADRRRQEQCAARVHVRLGSGHTIGQQFVIVETVAGRRVISGDCVYSRRQFTGHNNDGIYVPLNNAIGSVWEQLKTIDKMHDELEGDLSRLVVLHDIERWKSLPVVKELEGFRIVKVA